MWIKLESLLEDYAEQDRNVEMHIHLGIWSHHCQENAEESNASCILAKHKPELKKLSEGPRRHSTQREAYGTEN